MTWFQLSPPVWAPCFMPPTVRDSCGRSLLAWNTWGSSRGLSARPSASSMRNKLTLRGVRISRGGSWADFATECLAGRSVASDELQMGYPCEAPIPFLKGSAEGRCARPQISPESSPNGSQFHSIGSGGPMPRCGAKSVPYPLRCLGRWSSPLAHRVHSCRRHGSGAWRKSSPLGRGCRHLGRCLRTRCSPSDR